MEKILNVIKDLSGIDNICVHDNLKEDLGFDSLMMVMLIVGLEENFDIELTESDMNPFELKTVEDVMTLIQRYQGEKE